MLATLSFAIFGLLLVLIDVEDFTALRNVNPQNEEVVV
jgi:hypothetical protein